MGDGNRPLLAVGPLTLAISPLICKVTFAALWHAARICSQTRAVILCPYTRCSHDLVESPLGVNDVSRDPHGRYTYVHSLYKVYNNKPHTIIVIL